MPDVAGAYLWSDDAALCWKSVGRGTLKKWTAGQTGMMRAAFGMVLAEIFGDDRSKLQAMAETNRAFGQYISEVAAPLPSTPLGDLPEYIREAMADTVRRGARSRRRLSRRPTRIKGRRTRSKRKKR